MKKFIEYIDTCLPEERGNNLLYKFKRMTLDEMNREFKAANSRGISNDRVFADLVISQHNNLKAEYEQFCYNETVIKKRKRNIKLNIIGSIIYIILLIVTFIEIGLTTHIWSPTWLIVVDGILIWTSYILFLFVNRIAHMKRIFHIFARIMLAMAVMVISIAVFLFSLSYLHITKSWLVVISGIAAMFVSDMLFIAIKKQKLAIINILIYIPVIFTMLFIITCAAGLFAWGTGWKLIIVGLFVDAAIIVISILRNKKEEREVYSEWNED